VGDVRASIAAAMSDWIMTPGVIPSAKMTPGDFDD
jgi:hypothetical protein